MDIRFEWDPFKAESNVRKHGVSFELAQMACLDPLAIFEVDRIDQGEVRWHSLGKAGEFLLLLVVHTMVDLSSGGELIRIISARRATGHEWRRYERETR
jgi:uncharacterized DUF497 family protein